MSRNTSSNRNASRSMIESGSSSRSRSRIMYRSSRSSSGRSRGNNRSMIANYNFCKKISKQVNLFTLYLFL